MNSIVIVRALRFLAYRYGRDNGARASLVQIQWLTLSRPACHHPVSMDALIPTSYVAPGEILIRLGLAAAFASVLGIDRELRHKPVGLRSFILVSVGAAAFCLITMEVFTSFETELDLALDPSRTIQGVIGGIGFLGAGAIIQDRGQVRGVTTGACIWVTGAIGVACGFGLFLHAGALTVIATIVLTVLGVIEKYFGKGSRHYREIREDGS
jgi:putative Mg2+ transporter-C (MgtC) family protein